MTITCDKHTFNFLQKEGFTFLVVADEAYGRQIPFAFLERVSEDFLASHATRAKAAAPHSLDRTFGPRIKQHMVRVGKNSKRHCCMQGARQSRRPQQASTRLCQHNPAHLSLCVGRRLRPALCCVRACLQDYCTNNPDEISQIAACQKKIGDVKNVMVENIEKVGGSLRQVVGTPTQERGGGRGRERETRGCHYAADSARATGHAAWSVAEAGR